MRFQVRIINSMEEPFVRTTTVERPLQPSEVSARVARLVSLPPVPAEGFGTGFSLDLNATCDQNRRKRGCPLTGCVTPLNFSSLFSSSIASLPFA